MRIEALRFRRLSLLTTIERDHPVMAPGEKFILTTSHTIDVVESRNLVTLQNEHREF